MATSWTNDAPKAGATSHDWDSSTKTWDASLYEWDGKLATIWADDTKN